MGKTFDKVKQISLADNTTKRICLHISDDLLKKRLDKLKKVHSSGVQLDEIRDNAICTMRLRQIHEQITSRRGAVCFVLQVCQ